MRIEKAIALLVETYHKAKADKHIKNPTAYALYQVWKVVDKSKERDDNETD